MSRRDPSRQLECEIGSVIPRQRAARGGRRILVPVRSLVVQIDGLVVPRVVEIHFDADEAAKLQWHQHWIYEGFDAIETKLAGSALTGRFCVGDTPTIADAFLAPQVYNANRYHCKLDAYPNIRRINDHCLELAAFIDAAPEQQADFVT